MLFDCYVRFLAAWGNGQVTLPTYAHRNGFYLTCWVGSA